MNSQELTDATHSRVMRIMRENPNYEAYKVAQIMYGTQKPIGGQVSAVRKMMNRLIPEPSFLTKSKDTRTMELTEAYRINKKLRDNLELVKERDIMLMPNDKLRITREVHRLDIWIYETEQVLMVKFETE